MTRRLTFALTRWLIASGAVLLAAACASERPVAETTAAVTSTAANGALGGDTARRADSIASAPTAGGPGTGAPVLPNVVANPPGGAGAPRGAVPSTTPKGSGAAGKTAPARDTTQPGTASAQQGTAVAEPPREEPIAQRAPAAPPRAPLPYSPGERLAYDVKFGSVDVGDAVMEVLGLENVRGRQAHHIRFNVKGGTFVYKVNDRYESWIDTLRLVSLRHWQQIDEGSYERQRRYEIMPEIGTYKENEKPEQPTVAEPLDDGSFFYFLRTIPLEVGKTYTFDRYFRPDRNPVTVTVIRRERIKVPAGSFDAIVLHPTIKAKGVFGEGGKAEIWLADDSSKIMLQMKSRLKIGSLNLYLKSIRRGGS